MRRLSPSTARVGVVHKAAHSLALLRDYIASRREAPNTGVVFDDVAEYEAALMRHGGAPLSEARVFEIGFGAQPYRLIALLSMGVDARGVDAEVPVLHGTPGEYRAALRHNGAERALKSFVRRTLFDGRIWADFESELGRRGLNLEMPSDRFLVSDAALSPIEPASLDLVYSEDVFEHIALPSLQALLPKLATWLKPGGLALIRPNVFTGITGGHLVEWNRRSFAVGAGERGSDAWDHLRQKRFSANTYLNRLTRADYRSLFGAHFEILDEKVKLPGLGREFLTPEVARELADYPEEELFSNQVLFTLRPLNA